MDACEVIRVLDALSALGIRVAVTGGWGIDALLRRQTRLHGDADLAVPAGQITAAVQALASLGYTVSIDERPARVVLVSSHGSVDLHPIVFDTSGRGLQTGLAGETFDYPPGSLEAEGEIAGRVVLCGTPDLQLSFHLGYDPKSHDRRDMEALASAFRMTLPPPYSN